MMLAKGDFLKFEYLTIFFYISMFFHEKMKRQRDGRGHGTEVEILSILDAMNPEKDTAVERRLISRLRVTLCMRLPVCS